MIVQKRNPSDLLVVKRAVINAPIAVVFSVLEDIALFVELEENVKSVEITSETKRGLGMTSHWELEDPATKAQWSVDERVIAYEPPRLFVYEGRAADGNDYTGAHVLSKQEDGTTVLEFTEAFHFPGDQSLLDHIVGGMVSNVKKLSEQRYGKAENG